MKATITVLKTIQEVAFEPFSVTITLEKDVKNDLEIEELYQRVLDIVDKKMNERLEALED